MHRVAQHAGGVPPRGLVAEQAFTPAVRPSAAERKRPTPRQVPEVVETRVAIQACQRIERLFRAPTATATP